MKNLSALLLIFCFLVSPLSAKNVIKLATTTSTDNSGLLKILLPPFENKYNTRVDVIAVGTGKAIKLGRNGDIDLILVHDRQAEEEFIDQGFGVNRRHVMYNDFVLLGPENDPAGVKGSKNIFSALKKIAVNRFPFISRGDYSGTHKKELTLWKKVKMRPRGAGYLSVGQGMGNALQIADEKQAYILSDRGTYLAYKKKIDLILVHEGDKALYNPYSVIAVNPAVYHHTNYNGAMLLIGWLTSVDGQKIIKDFNVDGKQLFHPLAVK